MPPSRWGWLRQVHSWRDSWCSLSPVSVMLHLMVTEQRRLPLRVSHWPQTCHQPLLSTYYVTDTTIRVFMYWISFLVLKSPIFKGNPFGPLSFSSRARKRPKHSSWLMRRHSKNPVCSVRKHLNGKKIWCAKWTSSHQNDLVRWESLDKDSA